MRKNNVVNKKGRVNMFGNKITKTISIEGMSCGHCARRVEEALKGVNGVKSAKVNLEAKNAEVTLKIDVPNDTLKSAVEEAGYEVIEIE